MKWMLFGLIIVAGVSGAAMFLAVDARQTVADLEAENSELRSRLVQSKPTLVVQQRTADPFAAPRVAPDGEMDSILMSCPNGSVAVGGGFNTFDGVNILGSVPTGGAGGRSARGDGWLVNAANQVGGRGRTAPAVLCARGEGGLAVRSTADVSAKATKALGG